MHKFFYPRLMYIVLLMLVLIVLTSCGGNASSNDAPAVVESYLQALVEKDANKMINLSCAEWEPQARTEYDSFAAVDLRLEDLSCQVADQEEPYTLVSCKGSMIASYGAEDLEIDVAEQTYKVIQENGEWRMCGYR